MPYLDRNRVNAMPTEKTNKTDTKRVKQTNPYPYVSILRSGERFCVMATMYCGGISWISVSSHTSRSENVSVIIL